VLAALAAVLVIVGLVLATTAPAGPSANNKVDAYGGPVPQKPTNPKNRAACDKFYSATNKLAEAQGCRATAAYNVAKKACAKKSGAKRAACLKAAKRKYTAAKAKVAKQAKAEKACQTAYTAALQSIQAQIDALDPNDPNYDAQRAQLEAQQTAAGTTQQACLKKAQSS
jgi:glycine/D-amino acid oxidase-like deaminating enzyme